MSDPDDSAGASAGSPAGGDPVSGPDSPVTGDATGGTGGTDLTELDTAEILDAEDLGEPRRLDPNVRYLWVVGSLFGAVVGGVVAGVAMEFVAGATGLYDVAGSLPLGFSMTSVYLGAAIAGLLVFIAVARAVLYYRSWRYEVRSDSLFLTRGVLTRVGTVAPYVRVQHIDTRRSPLERLLGLSSLVVYTAGSRGADVTIPGLTDERAAELQTRLKRLAIASEEEDAV